MSPKDLTGMRYEGEAPLPEAKQSNATGQSSPFDAWVKLVEYIGKEVHPGSTMEALMYDVDEAFQRQKDAPPFTRPADELAKKLDACKLIVVDYGSFSEFTGKAAVPTDLLGEVVACLKSIPSATEQKPARDPNVKYPRLFYWEETENCWCPADGLEVENIIDTHIFLADGEETEIRFKRQDMTEAEFDAIPEG
jgi:hypothetical protein